MLYDGATADSLPLQTVRPRPVSARCHVPKTNDTKDQEDAGFGESVMVQYDLLEEMCSLLEGKHPQAIIPPGQGFSMDCTGRIMPSGKRVLDCIGWSVALLPSYQKYCTIRWQLYESPKRKIGLYAYVIPHKKKKHQWYVGQMTDILGIEIDEYFDLFHPPAYAARFKDRKKQAQYIRTWISKKRGTLDE